MSYNYSKNLPKPNLDPVKEQKDVIPALNKLISHAKQNSPSIEQELVAIERALQGHAAQIVTVLSAGGGGGGGGTSGYKTIQSQGNPIAQRSTMDFEGDIVGAADDGSRSVITLTNPDEVTITMIDTVAAFDVATINGHKADSSIVAYKDKVIGLAMTGISSGFSGSVKIGGEITNPAWTWTAGDNIFLNGTGLSTTAPSTGFIQQIGRAKTNITIEITLGPSVLL